MGVVRCFTEEKIKQEEGLMQDISEMAKQLKKLESKYERCIQRIVRYGTVTDLDDVKRLARVKFMDTGKTSDWLVVLQHYRASVPDGSSPSCWMPKVNDTVLALCLPIDNGDGFILGGF